MYIISAMWSMTSSKSSHKKNHLNYCHLKYVSSAIHDDDDKGGGGGDLY